LGIEAETKAAQIEVSQMGRSRQLLHRVWLVGMALALSACASSPSGISLRPIPKPTPANPVAVSHFVDARLYELRGQRELAINSLRAAIAVDSTSATLFSVLARNLAAANRFAEAADPAHKALLLDPTRLDTRWIYYESLVSGTRDTALALAELDILARQETEPIKAFQQMLNIHNSRADEPAVLLTLDRITALPDLHENGKMIAAQNYQTRNANAKAEALIQDVLSRNPKRGDAWVKLANLQVQKGDTLSAAISLRSALTNSGGRVRPGPVWRQLVNLYAPKRRMDALLAETPPDLIFQEQLAEVYRNVAKSGNAAQSQHFLERSAMLFNNLTRLTPDRADLFAKQGELLLSLKRPADARASFIHAAKIENRPEYHLGTAHTLIFQRQFDLSLKILEHIKPKVPKGSEFYDQTILSLGNVYAATGRGEDARNLYLDAIKHSPENTTFPYELAEAYARERNWEQAIKAYRELLPRVEEHPVALGQTLYGLARVLERGGGFEESARTFERLLSLHPNHADALNYLGYMFSERGVRLGEAENFIKRALETDPNNGAYLDSLGWVYYQTGDYRRAQEFLKRAIDQEEAELKKLGETESGRRKSMRENIAVIYDHAGDCALAINQFGEAQRWWRLALENDPQIAKTGEKLAKLIESHGSADDRGSAR
jgi:tetratricopeptide (TPR) repeat protein